MPSELKPCPFCGGSAFTEHLVEYTTGGDMEELDDCYVTCRSCGCCSKVMESLEQAVEVWNRRPAAIDRERVKESAGALEALLWSHCHCNQPSCEICTSVKKRAEDVIKKFRTALSDSPPPHRTQ